MSTYYDRYNSFLKNNEILPIPGILIPQSNNDKTAIYQLGKTRLDKVSQRYYNNPYSGWLILLANPEYGGLEFKIPDQARLRIPFPYSSAIQAYKDAIQTYSALYGIGN